LYFQFIEHVYFSNTYNLCKFDRNYELVSKNIQPVLWNRYFALPKLTYYIYFFKVFFLVLLLIDIGRNRGYQLVEPMPKILIWKKKLSWNNILKQIQQHKQNIKGYDSWLKFHSGKYATLGYGLSPLLY